MTIDLNSSWPSNFFEKYFIIIPINFSFLLNTSLWYCFRVIFTKEINIEKVKPREVLYEVFSSMFKLIRDGYV